MNKTQLMKIARSQIKGFIYFQARMDNQNVTFPETETILEIGYLKSVDDFAVEMILELKKAYQYVLSSIDEELNLEYIIHVNKLVAHLEALEVGKLRDSSIGISGVEKRWPPVDVQTVELILKKDFSKIENCVDLFLEMCTLQLFFDGNKRTSALILNKLLITNELGYFTIEEKGLAIFSKLLNDYYNEKDNSKETIRNFIIDNCIISELIYEKPVKYQDLGFKI